MEEFTVLLAEDEISLGHIVRESLEERNFKVILCTNGEMALKQYAEKKPDIVVLDIMMPLMDGFTVAKNIRIKDNHTPIIFLTAKSQAKDVVAGFGIGANDYVKKPFSIEELIVRIQVHLSKRGILETKVSSVRKEYKIGEFIFLPHKNIIVRGIIVTQLTSRESDVLNLLCQNQQQVVPKGIMLSTLWGSDSFYNARSLDVFISKLRKLLSADINIQILNVRGIGFKLVF
ncbi:response regulator transcription factor [Pedobacter nutrimenti]|uniref:response regulator transcription factor n=1 Tax=Pedobacter nutrimenti TaxID=1241337 RepID=UPI00293183B1|nr:response regulator transcription factor [Pedobacter nutrimenti]